ncbi:hypothetical protein FBU59_001132 [Linderina macrospora]|uniref:Uncharacterized protein n=1 Tax=Linderina macrospora TaxID=4868 RepID=A0ACC1JF46_9FUNG|nr:hypothetical protein FBU59_001132 [Linderina macrospora]
MNAVRNEGIGIVKNFTVGCPRDMILDGTYIVQLGGLPDACKVLPGVNTLDLSILSSKNMSDIDLDEFEDSISAFCSAIRAMFPNVSKLAVTGSTHRVQPKDDRLVSMITSQLMNQESSPIPAESSVVKFSQPYSNLQQLHGNLESKDSPFIELARRHAPTLTALTIRTDTPEVTYQICYSSTGDELVYSQLRSLALCPSSPRLHPDAEYTFRKVSHAPFPALCAFDSTGPYPFADGVVFRGNKSTLGKLTAVLTKHNWTALLANSMLTKDRAMSLDVAEYTYLGMHDNQLVLRDVVQTVLHATSTLKGFRFDAFRPIAFEPNWPLLETIGSRMVSFRMGTLECTPEQVISLVKVLPCVRTLEIGCIPTPLLLGSDTRHAGCDGVCRLHVHSGVSAKLAVDVQFMSTHMDYVCSGMGAAEELYIEHYPLSMTLMNLHVGKTSTSYVPSSRLIVLMALLCPKFGDGDFGGQAEFGSLRRRLEETRQANTAQRVLHA